MVGYLSLWNLLVVSVLEPANEVVSERLNEAEKGLCVAVAFSNGIRKLRHISHFLRVADVVSPAQAVSRQLTVSCVVVWGRKTNSLRALEYASRHSLPIIYLEDGWIRSCSENPHSRVCYSLIIDQVGVYYDSSVPSSLECSLNLPDEEFNELCGERELAYAATCRQLLVDSNISKYNFCVDPNEEQLRADTRELVLVIDQTHDDVSVRLGSMDAQAFKAMLDRALLENPAARVVVRTHPDVVAGRRKGYLNEYASHLGVELSACADNPILWLKQATTVYVGTSQLGYEALLCGCTVKVAGLPFYAGWGLTEDTQTVARRVRQRSLDQVFYVAHVLHARYCCPVTGSPWSLSDCLAHVRLQKTYFEKNAGDRVCVGITPWKRRYLSQFLRSPYGRVRFSAKNDAAEGEIPLCWSFSDSDGKLSKSRGSATSAHGGPPSLGYVRIEDGFIRSMGLGSDYVPPASLVFDEIGLYFDASAASTLELLLNTYHCTEAEIGRAQKLREAVLSENLTKYNVGEQYREPSSSSSTQPSELKILVVGQVEGDQSVLRGGRDVNSNAGLLTAVRKLNPDAFIVYKPHPDVVSGNRKGSVESSILSSCVDKIEDSRHFLDCLEECDEIHTMTSLSGFEAILRGKKVVTYGLPFYAGWGLTKDMLTCERRKISRSVDELVFLCLIKYPHYVDLDSGEFISVEQLIEKLRHSKAINNERVTGVRWVNKLANVYGALAYKV